MAMTMVMQIPKFFRAIVAEHKLVEQIVRTHQIDVIISDNRYGCWSKHARSVFITHQSNIMMPRRFGWLSGVVRKLNERLIRKFSQCWIPDFSGENSLAGALADVRHFKDSTSIRYIGTISRFKRTDISEKKYDLLCIFSGPEPQRSVLEEIVVKQLVGESLRVAIVRGIPSTEHKKALTIHGDVFDMLTTSQLQRLIDTSEIILARSGFSTVMDLASLRKKAIFIPTPGQTEQEYLAARLMEKGVAYSMRQADFELHKGMQQVQIFKGFEDLPEETTLLDGALVEVLR
jgi:uncharacterized protein (TIGR00661 family)